MSDFDVYTYMEKLKAAIDGADFLSFVLYLKKVSEAGLLEDAIDKNEFETPLSYALRVMNLENGNLVFVEELLKKGASPDVWDAEIDTPLMKAAGTGNTELANLLLKYGANVDLMDGDHTWTVWDVAYSANQTEMLTLLEKHGAKSGQEY